MALKALIFDVDGTLADTERDGHMAACNVAFATLGYPIQWTWEEYKRLLEIQGNRPRMRLALARQYPDKSDAALDAEADRLFALKQQLYVEKYVTAPALRPGVQALVDEAIACNVRLAIVTSSVEAQVEALLRYRLPHAADLFQPILGQTTGRKTAPDSPLYRRCLVELGLPASEVLVIEDSWIGLQAALTAGLPCAVFYNDYTFGEDFRGAALVARSLEPFNLDRLAALCLPME